MKEIIEQLNTQLPMLDHRLRVMHQDWYDIYDSWQEAYADYVHDRLLCKEEKDVVVQLITLINACETGVLTIDELEEYLTYQDCNCPADPGKESFLWLKSLRDFLLQQFGIVQQNLITELYIKRMPQHTKRDHRNDHRREDRTNHQSIIRD